MSWLRKIFASWHSDVGIALVTARLNRLEAQMAARGKTN